uniref:Uncharacterized protein n=1 Tax=Oryza meridionalis TaxID=40149 RepID=A0A0E0C8Y6_9ORYZ
MPSIFQHIDFTFQFSIKYSIEKEDLRLEQLKRRKITWHSLIWWPITASSPVAGAKCAVVGGRGSPPIRIWPQKGNAEEMDVGIVGGTEEIDVR